jgi:homoserine acetyltransferase
MKYNQGRIQTSDIGVAKNNYVQKVYSRKITFHACRLVEKVVLSLERTGKNNKEPKNQIFIVIDLRGEKKVKESNQYRRKK